MNQKICLLGLPGTSLKKIVFLLLFLLIGLGNLHSQPSKEAYPRVSIESKNEPLSSVLKRIEQLSEYKVLFT